MSELERGPLERLRAEQLIWLAPAPNFQAIVAADLAALAGVDAALARAADAIAHAGDGFDDDGIAGDLAEAFWQLGDLDGVLDPRDLDAAAAAVLRAEFEIGDQRRELPPADAPPTTYDPG